MELIVIIPALNEEGLIKHTLECLDRQSNNNFSVIVVDNGSKDRTIEIVDLFGQESVYDLSLIEESRKGVGYARDAGSKEAINRGAMFLAGTDSDTTIPRGWIQSIFDGFQDKDSDLLSGESNLLGGIKTDNRSVVHALAVRSAIFNKVRPYVRGHNFAITSEMFQKIDGIKQPLTPEGKPAPGEDVQIGLEVLKHGGKFLGDLLTVSPSPRRYIDAMRRIAIEGGALHKDGIVTEVRGDNTLEKSFNEIPDQVIEAFSRKMIKDLFNENFVNVYKNEVYRENYWGNVANLLPQFTSDEIEKDIESLDTSALWEKYGEIYISKLLSS